MAIDKISLNSDLESNIDGWKHTQLERKIPNVIKIENEIRLLYLQELDRLPHRPGLDHYLKKIIDEGLPLEYLGEILRNSPEGKAKNP